MFVNNSINNNGYYTVKLEQFEGPLDLLLELIEEEKLEITKISLAKVAGQYLEYIKKIENIKPECLAFFLSIAARLVLLKSRAILPILELTEEEEEDINELQRKLEEYRRFRIAALKLGKISKSGKTSFSKESFWGVSTFFYPPKNITTNDLKSAFRKILAEIPEFQILPQEKMARALHLEDRIKEIQEFLKEKIEMSFGEMIKNKSSRVDVIVSFLALLELVKQRLVMTRQEGLFSEIYLKNTKNI